MVPCKRKFLRHWDHGTSFTVRCPCDQAKYEPSGAKATVQFSRPHFLSKGAAGAKSSPIVRDLTISFSLTLGGKLAIYGAPSDSGGAMRTQRQRRDPRTLRGVTRDRSLPDRGTEGRGGGGGGSLCRLPRESSGRLRTKLRSQTQTIDPAPCLKPTDQDTSSDAANCKPDTGDKMAGGAGDSRAARAGSRDVTTRGPAPRRSGRDGLVSAPRPVSVRNHQPGQEEGRG